MAAAAGAAPNPEASVYRFGQWTVVAPVHLAASEVSPGPYPLSPPQSGSEWLLYFGDGSQRALALRFSGNAKSDTATLRTHDFAGRLKGCNSGFGFAASLPSLKAARPAAAEISDWPDDSRVVIAGSDRGLRRVGEDLIADLGPFRVKITDDSPVVRVGEWDSADFCRYELNAAKDD